MLNYRRLLSGLFDRKVHGSRGSERTKKKIKKSFECQSNREYNAGQECVTYPNGREKCIQTRRMCTHDGSVEKEETIEFDITQGRLHTFLEIQTESSRRRLPMNGQRKRGERKTKE